MATGSGDAWPALPLKARLRLWTDQRVNTVAVWLADHGCYRTAVLLWRLFRVW